MTRARYVVGPIYDWSWFLLPPLASLALGVAVSRWTDVHRPLVLAGQELSAEGLFLGALIHSHLVAVLVRSHGNPTIRRRHPVRFLAVPVLLWVAIVASPWIAVTASVVATFWDVYHSGAQTFGFARMYDRNLGNPPDAGRRLDFWLNQLLYAGPVLAGVTLIDHLAYLDDYESLGATLFAAVPAHVDGWQRYATWTVVGAGTVFLLFYVRAYLRLHRAGYRVSRLKVFLLATTGACSIYTWGFDSWGEAFFIMNLFHGVQYLALVWAVERKQLQQRLRFLCRGNGVATCAVYLAGVFGYGVLAELTDSNATYLWAATIVVSLMHFWYDGFVWSVRRSEV